LYFVALIICGALELAREAVAKVNTFRRRSFLCLSSEDGYLNDGMAYIVSEQENEHYH
jgi:hypothetical protein